ncbi:restriction endonuclease [Halalkalibacter akibai]|uniref:Restriction endonuclease type IV Mrr domain-containing protein n=1 Tax=Halalkalibacter akibai (strain ATCC 43226 / DSM 21942 / CIP 109018 / JCM 9157 / 1139) TaxID=1236973 RepID=W4QWJ4_HALA3|nr:restriction endonuclease [Halalkalibacter akibai]GAE35699.1 hypothetical protein JCM9157_2818 [Halalkalibacter akibai JCM 9157]
MRRKKQLTASELKIGLYMFLILAAIEYPWLLIFVFIYTLGLLGLLRTDWNKFRYWRLKDKLKVAAVVYFGILFLSGFTENGVITLVVSNFFVIILLGITIYGGIKIIKFFFIKHSPIIEGIAEVDNMDGIEFEHYLGKVYNKLGYYAEVTKPTGDFGADLILKRGKDKIAVQAKCNGEGNNVGVDAINEVLGGAGVHGANKKIVVTNRYFTKNAKISATANNVKLVNRDNLIMMIKEVNSQKTVPNSVEPI